MAHEWKLVRHNHYVELYVDMIDGSTGYDTEIVAQKCFRCGTVRRRDMVFPDAGIVQQGHMDWVYEPPSTSWGYPVEPDCKE